MPSGNILFRIVIAIIFAILAHLLVPPVADILGFPLSGAFLKIINVCIAGGAVLYILRGKP